MTRSRASKNSPNQSSASSHRSRSPIKSALRRCSCGKILPKRDNHTLCIKCRPPCPKEGCDICSKWSPDRCRDVQNSHLRGARKMEYRKAKKAADANDVTDASSIASSHVSAYSRTSRRSNRSRLDEPNLVNIIKGLMDSNLQGINKRLDEVSALAQSVSAGVSGPQDRRCDADETEADIDKVHSRDSFSTNRLQSMPIAAGLLPSGSSLRVERSLRASPSPSRRRHTTDDGNTGGRFDGSKDESVERSPGTYGKADRNASRSPGGNVGSDRRSRDERSRSRSPRRRERRSAGLERKQGKDKYKVHRHLKGTRKRSKSKYKRNLRELERYLASNRSRYGRSESSSSSSSSEDEWEYSDVDKYSDRGRDSGSSRSRSGRRSWKAERRPTMQACGEREMERGTHHVSENVKRQNAVEHEGTPLIINNSTGSIGDRTLLNVPSVPKSRSPNRQSAVSTSRHATMANGSVEVGLDSHDQNQNNDENSDDKEGNDLPMESSWVRRIRNASLLLGPRICPPPSELSRQEVPVGEADEFIYRPQSGNPPKPAPPLFPHPGVAILASCNATGFMRAGNRNWNRRTPLPVPDTNWAHKYFSLTKDLERKSHFAIDPRTDFMPIEVQLDPDSSCTLPKSISMSLNDFTKTDLLLRLSFNASCYADMFVAAAEARFDEIKANTSPEGLAALESVKDLMAAQHSSMEAAFNYSVRGIGNLLLARRDAALTSSHYSEASRTELRTQPLHAPYLFNLQEESIRTRVAERAAKEMASHAFKQQQKPQHFRKQKKQQSVFKQPQPQSFTIPKLSGKISKNKRGGKGGGRGRGGQGQGAKRPDSASASGNQKQQI